MSVDKLANAAAALAQKRAAKNPRKEDKPRDFEELHLIRARILGVLIRDARQAAEQSIEQCASQLSIPAQTLEEWELGQSTPSLPQLELLSYQVNVPISHFWGTEVVLKQSQHRPVDAQEYVLLRNRVIGALLRAIRQQRNLSLDQLAAASGITAHNLNAYELGQRPIPTPVLISLATGCGVNLSYFLENGNRVGSFLILQEDLKNFSDLPENVRHFVVSPINQPYIELAMKLSQMGTDQLRGIAEAILEITL
jgi:transcriptional regulator with XRE-family HTH domain